MDYTIQDRFSMKLRKNGNKLGFNTGLPNRSFAVTNFRDLRSVPGWIVSPDGKIKTWEIDGVTEIDGQVVIYGPWEKGRRGDRGWKCSEGGKRQGLRCVAWV